MSLKFLARFLPRDLRYVDLLVLLPPASFQP